VIGLIGETSMPQPSWSKTYEKRNVGLGGGGVKDGPMRAAQYPFQHFAKNP